jgi:starvation-inducible DNA-binding protein
MSNKVHLIKNEGASTTVNEAMANTLATTYGLYLMTQYCHWNVTGPHFGPLHQMFEAQYSDLATAIDDTAERIRAIGHVPEGSFKHFQARSVIEEMLEPCDAMTMVKKLLVGNEALVSLLRDTLHLAEKAKDDATVDFLAGRIGVHEKNTWMLRSTLEK